MFYHSPRKSPYSFFIVSLLLALLISFAPVQPVSADVSTSDLAIQLISAPKTAKSCQVFQAKFQVTNLGPD